MRRNVIIKQLPGYYLLIASRFSVEKIDSLEQGAEEADLETKS